MRRALAAVSVASFVSALLGCGGVGGGAEDPCQPAVVRTEREAEDRRVRLDLEGSVWDDHLRVARATVVDRKGRLVTEVQRPRPDVPPRITADGDLVGFAEAHGWTHCAHVRGLPQRCVDGGRDVDRVRDDAGRLVQLRATKGTRSFTWRSGRVVEEVHERGGLFGTETVRYRYDEQGRVSSWTTERPVPTIDLVSWSDTRVVRHHRNGMPAHVEQVGRDLHSGEPNPQHDTTTFDYDELGRPTAFEMTYGGGESWRYGPEGFVEEHVDHGTVVYREERAGGTLVAVHRGHEHGNYGPLNRYEVTRRGDELCIGPLQPPPGPTPLEVVKRAWMVVGMMLFGGGSPY